MSHHAKYEFLDYTFRPSAGLSTRAITHLRDKFNDLSGNPTLVIGVFALEAVESQHGTLNGTRHVHIRFWCKKPVEPYAFFGRKYSKYPDGTAFVTNNLEDRPRTFHSKYFHDQDKWKLGYLFKGEAYEVISSDEDVHEDPQFSDFINTCYAMYQQHDEVLKVKTWKLTQVTKKNFGPILMEYHQQHWPDSHFNWREVIIHMVNSKLFNFTFMPYRFILQIQCSAPNVPDAVILEAFEYDQTLRPLGNQYAQDPMSNKKRKRTPGYLTELGHSQRHLEWQLLNIAA